MKPVAEPTTLKRTVGLATLTFYGLGNILGAGIYVLIGSMAAHAGMFTPISFLVASLVALFSVLTYAELSSRFPFSAGEAVYVQEGLRITFLSRLVGMMVAAAGMLAAAAIIRGVNGYIQVFVDLPFSLIIVVLVISIGLLAIWGISESTNTAAALTLLETFGLLLVVWAAGKSLDSLPARIDELIPSMQLEIWGAILPAAFLAFFAFLGFEDMVNIAEEVKNPTRNMPLAILLALVISTTLYILVALVSVLSVEPARLAASNAPLALVYEQATGRTPAVLSLIGSLAAINGALIPMIMASRVLYGMARKGLLWGGFATVNARTRTPIGATIAVCLTILSLSLWLPVRQLASGTSYLILAAFILVNSSLIVIKLRERQQALAQRKGYPLWVPIFGLLCSIGLLLGQTLN